MLNVLFVQKKSNTMKNKKNLTFEDLIFSLQKYWQENNCTIVQPLDLEVGAGTFHPATLLKSLGHESWNCAYVQQCRRPTDGRYGENPNRLQQYFQFQVLLKPSPINIQELYLKSLNYLGIDLKNNDVRFVEDDWESPTLGAWGLGWEVWCNGMEISQFTYFQQVGGIDCNPVSGEITYGLERLAMLIQEKTNVFDLLWSKNGNTYKEIFLDNEIEQSYYNFDYANTENIRVFFEFCEIEAKALIEKELVRPAYEKCVKASHFFNLLDSRGVLSVSERASYIKRVREISKSCCELYVKSKEIQ